MPDRDLAAEIDFALGLAGMADTVTLQRQK